LIFVVFYLSSKFFWKQPVPPQTQQYATENTQQVAKPPMIPPTQENDLEADVTPLDLQSDIPLNNDIVLENNDIKVVLTNRGGNIKQVVLKNIKNEAQEDAVNLFIKESGMFNIVFYTSSDTINFRKQNLEYTYDEFTATFFIEKDFKRIFEKHYSIDDNYTVNITIKADGLGFIDTYDIQLDAGIYYDQKAISVSTLILMLYLMWIII